MDYITIALDAMGGDYGCKVIVPAALAALKQHPEIKLILVGDQHLIKDELVRCSAQENERFSIHHSDEVVTMDESPSHALRNKKNSSMRIAINLVKEGVAAACVSAGNTGALMATAKFVLKTLPGIDRPAIISELPTVKGTSTRLLDLGANVDSCAEHLFQFAVMGNILIRAIDNISQPRVGLLNIGVEEIKGNDQVKRTADILAKSPNVNYVGFVEGDDIYKGTADLIVCDGFVGNVAIKTSEGLLHLLKKFIKQSFSQNLYTRFLGVLCYPILKALKTQIDPAGYNGASLLGLNGIVIKSHGGASALAFQYAITKALLEVKKGVPNLIRQEVSELLNEGMFI